ncbi:MAG: hypothetical protein CME35_11950, partial [Gramella sp.]|nr:hypothetical protein [Christiangramia sp.]
AVFSSFLSLHPQQLSKKPTLNEQHFPAKAGANIQPIFNYTIAFLKISIFVKYSFPKRNFKQKKTAKIAVRCK